jgi:hypothetical protein
MKAETMKTIIENLKAELVAANATKNAANEAMEADRFYAACDRIRDLELEIEVAYKGKSKVDSITKELIGNNCD